VWPTNTYTKMGEHPRAWAALRLFRSQVSAVGLRGFNEVPTPRIDLWGELYQFFYKIKFLVTFQTIGKFDQERV
jgi:hypothetical protein